MLASLKIENVAVIESAAIEFGCGLNVLTGETGAGKSIVIDAIGAVLGERTSKDVIRTGADSAKVYAVFEEVGEKVKSLLSEDGIECDDGVLIISRVINRDGKNVCRMNGCPVTVSMLKSVGRLLIDIHGQHDNQALLSPEKHIDYIDSFGGCGELLSEYRNVYSSLCKVRRQLKSLETDESEKARKVDMLSFQIDEIEKADISVGEKEELTQRKSLIVNSQKVMDNLNYVYEILGGDTSAVDMISSAADGLSSAANYLSELNEDAQKLEDMRYELEDIAQNVRTALGEIDCDERELDEIEERLDLIYRLSVKYGSTEEDILAYLETARAELDKINYSTEEAEKLAREEKKLRNEALSLAQKLSDKRQAAGEELSKAICDQLAFLDMPNVTFVIDRNETELTENGIDETEFLISANAGEAPKPLVKIASGGELSRIMLAIKTVLSGVDSTDTMIYDEIDTGVSGSAAQKIAMKLREVSENGQVLCVTHLAQIAAQGDVHLFISKSVRDGKTYTEIKSLVGEDRVHELARINGGITVTELQLESAREMLKNAENYLQN